MTEYQQLFKCSIARTIFVSIELIALIVLLILSFLLNDGSGIWGYWGIAVLWITIAPILVYVIASAVFNTLNMNKVLKKRHTAETVKQYYNVSKIFLVWGIMTGMLYGFLLPQIFLLENIFLFYEYRKERARIRNT